MADVIVGAKLTADASGATQSVKAFKTQLREAQVEAAAIGQKFGVTSKEAAEAAKRVAELKGAVSNTKSLIDAFNPDTKFRAFGSAINTVVGGFTALQGVMGLVGSESEDVQKALVKVQSALALSQGVAQLQEGLQTFKNLNAVIQQTAVFQKANAAATALATGAMKLFGFSVETTSVAFKVLKGAIIATGIGALFVLVTETISVIKDWVSGIDTAEKANKRLALAVDAVNNSLNKNIKELEVDTAKRLALAKKAGASEEELQKIRTQGAAKEIVELISAYNQKRDLYNKALADGKVTDEELNKLRDDAAKAQQEYIDKANEREIDRLNFEASQAEKGRQQLKSDLEKRLAIQKEADKKLREERLKDIQDATERNAIGTTTGLKIEVPKTQEQLQYEQEVAAKAELRKQDERALKLNDEFRASLRSNQKQRADEEEEEDNRVYNNKKAVLEATQGLLGALGDLIGRQTAAGKVLGIAQATINTFIGATEVLRAKSVLPEPAGTIVKIANVAAIIATGISAVKRIISTPVPGAGGGGSGSVPAPLAPVAPQASNTRLDQTSLNAIGAATTRAFVLEADVTNNQERIRRLNRAARI